MMEDENIKILRMIGLTEYESKVYLSLISLISSTAGVLSKESEVPRSKIYSVLESLEKKNLIKIREGRPLEYDVIDPSESLNNFKSNLMKNIDILQDNLIKLYENKLPVNDVPVTTILDIEKIMQKENHIIRKSNKIILIRLGFILPEEINTFRKNIKKLIENNVKVKIIAVRECRINNQLISIEEIFSDIDVEVKYVNLPSAQLIIRDYKEMILIFAENSGKSILNSNMVALYNTSSTIISNYVSAFNKKWGK